ncbi:MAG: alpha-L-rhamnosidase N-terminal domain-containing protein [Bacteroidetes bacterium]|nr:alpha-L-rhamnosidase N-terminal domain-containing protein [Bacteroidota bacterium]
MKKSIVFITICFVMSFSVYAQEIDLLHQPWKASWIAVPNTAANDYGVYVFRKKVSLNNKPENFLVHVSADNRYKLFVNEQMVSIGPARGDITHWNYETIDLAKYLKSGENTVAALVWNEGEQKPEAQISYRTGFLMQGANFKDSTWNTDSTWKCLQDTAYKALNVKMNTYYVTGPGEQINLKNSLKGWQKNDFNDAGWKKAIAISGAYPKNIMLMDMPVGWNLIASTLPPMEMSYQRLQKTIRETGKNIPAGFPATKTSFTIPAHTTDTILLDQSILTNAFPTIVFAKGKDASIHLGYAEALFTKFPSKGNRNETAGKIFIGKEDQIISDGSDNQSFTALNFRTYRYVQLIIQTKDEPIVINDLYGTFTGYPFTLKANFSAGNPLYNQILDIGWRTARLCAWETYTDCPYYEQLQYIGDTRIQALVSIYNTGDERLIKNALNQMNESRLPEGVTLSRHPSHTAQLIPTFSLWYIDMLHDYWMYGKDEAFVKDKLTGTRGILEFFKRFQQKDHSLKNVPYWNFTDWCDTKGWDGGRAPEGKDGYSAVMDLLLLYTYQMAADLELKIGIPALASQYNAEAKLLQQTIRSKYFDASKKLFSDRTEKDLYSQHANTLAILTGTSTGEEARSIATKMMKDTSITEATIFYKYYVYQALTKAGFGNDYLNWLDIWKRNIKEGLTTWAEISDINNARSDCHAWGASPNIEFFRTVLGIDSDAPSFKKVKVVPHLGNETNISGSIPHPAGTISTSYQYINAQWKIQIDLPKTITGKFEWKGKTYPLKEGKNSFNL